MRVLFVLRRKIGLTQLQLATQTGLTQAEISIAENGYTIRRLDRVQAELRRYGAIKELVPNEPNDLMMDWDEYRDRMRAESLAKVG